MADQSVANVWIGRIDRLSGASNAIVQPDDVKLDDKDEPAFDGEINLGPLPEEAVGERVTFIYESGTFGLCIDEKWVTESYFEEILPRTDISAEEMEVRSAIIDANSPEELTRGSAGTASPWIEGSRSERNNSGQPVVKIHPENVTSDENRVYLGVIEDTVPLRGFPCKVQVIDIRGAYVVVEPQTVELASGVPEVGEVCTVQTKDLSAQGTIAVYDADRSIPVLIREIEYPLEEALEVRITGRNAAYLIAEPELRAPSQLETISALDVEPSDSISRIIRERTPIDVRPLPVEVPQPDKISVFDKTENALLGAWDVQAVSGGHNDLTTGETIEVTIDSIEEDRLVSFRDDFPIICDIDTELPDELQDIRLKVTIQSIEPDRATATLTTPPFEKGDVVNIKADGSADGDLFSVRDGYLFQTESSGLIPSEQCFRAGIESLGPISRASVNALPEFCPDEERVSLVRLHSTEDDFVLVNGVPIDTKKLPDLTSPVILGIEQISTDHVVPSVAALPDSHTPDIDDSLIVTLEESTASVTVSAVGEQLPIELWKPYSMKLDQTYARIFDHQDHRLRAIATTISDDKSAEVVVEKSQLATTLMAEGEYSAARSALSVARSQLPSEYPIAEAIVDARYALLCATDLLSKDTDRSTTDLLHRVRDQTSGDYEKEISDDLSQILEVYNLEITAAIACVEAYEDANRNTASRLQAIARGAEGKQPVREAIQKLRTASQRMGTENFGVISPSVEIMRFLRKFEERFPYPVDELVAWRSEHEPHDLDDKLPGTLLPVNIDAISDEASCFELPPVDNHSDEIWERSIADTETILQTPDERVQSESQDTTQQDSSEGSFLNQPDPKQPNRDKDDALNDHSIEVTTDTNPGTDDPSESKSVKDDVSQTESTQPVDQEESIQTTDSIPNENTESLDITEPSVSTSDSEGSGPDAPGRVATTEIPEATSKLRELRQQAEADASKNPIKHTTTTTTGNQYQRSNKIRDYALARADGQCEACGDTAPFNRPSGEPFLEVHHVNELGKGGADDPALVVAICPNCHREIHYGEYGDELNEQLRSKLEDGLGDVGSSEFSGT